MGGKVGLLRRLPHVFFTFLRLWTVSTVSTVSTAQGATHWSLRVHAWRRRQRWKASCSSLASLHAAYVSKARLKHEARLNEAAAGSSKKCVYAGHI